MVSFMNIMNGNMNGNMNGISYEYYRSLLSSDHTVMKITVRDDRNWQRLDFSTYFFNIEIIG